MKVEYFFPVFLEDNIKHFLTVFKKSKCFNENKDYGFTFVCEKNDKQNLEFLSSEALRNEEIKILVLDKPFTYNDAFYFALPYFKADVVLLGDVKVARTDLVFEKCLEKYNKGANIVQISKKQTGLKGFFKNLRNKIYNFFVKIFTGKTDRNNVLSLGLIDKHIIDLLAVLPNKCCFLKNTKCFKGFESRTVYIDSKTKTYKVNYKKMTASLKTAIASFGIVFVLAVLQIVLNCLIKTPITVYNIISLILIFLGLTTSTIFIPKHFFELRNFESGQNFEVEKINFEKKKSEKKETEKQDKVLKDSEEEKPKTKTVKKEKTATKKMETKKSTTKKLTTKKVDNKKTTSKSKSTKTVAKKGN